MVIYANFSNVHYHRLYQIFHNYLAIELQYSNLFTFPTFGIFQLVIWGFVFCLFACLSHSHLWKIPSHSLLNIPRISNASIQLSFLNMEGKADCFILDRRRFQS